MFLGNVLLFWRHLIFVTIDETELNAELTSTKKDLETANKNNKTLEETIKSLKEKLKAYEENTVVSDGKKKVK